MPQRPEQRYSRWTTLERDMLRVDVKVPELATEVRISPSHLYEVIGGRVNPSRSLVSRLATRLYYDDPYELWKTRPVVPPRYRAPRKPRPASEVA